MLPARFWVLIVIVGMLAVGAARARSAGAASACGRLTAPTSLGSTLLAVHLKYMRRRPDEHDPHARGPVRPVTLGHCGTTDYAYTAFDQSYNGFHFGVTDQPEIFRKAAGHAWVDLGNVGGDLCLAPRPARRAWHLRCPR